MLVPTNTVKEFSAWYRGIHGYLALGMCAIGILSNIVNVIVLTRPRLRTPTNEILTAIAVFDVLTMITYTLFAFQIHVRDTSDTVITEHFWAYVIMLHPCVVIICHNAAMWLTAALAVFRYISIKFPIHAKSMCTSKRTRLVVGLIAVLTVLLGIPLTLSSSLTKKIVDNQTVYQIETSEIAEWNDYLLITISLWLYGIIFKCGCSIILTILSIMLVLAMREASRRHNNLRMKSTLNKNERSNRNTIMLTVIVLVFVLTEMPHGILVFISSFSEQFYFNYYKPLGDILDMLVLIECAVNFWLYVLMSAQFRQVFKSLLLSPISRRVDKIYQFQTQARLSLSPKPDSSRRKTQTQVESVHGNFLNPVTCTVNISSESGTAIQTVTCRRDQTVPIKIPGRPTYGFDTRVDKEHFLSSSPGEESLINVHLLSESEVEKYNECKETDI